MYAGSERERNAETSDKSASFLEKKTHVFKKAC